MLKIEKISSNVIRYYSDAGKYVRRVEDGEIFEERLDVVGGKWTYKESSIDLPLKEDENEKTISEQEKENNNTETQEEENK